MDFITVTGKTVEEAVTNAAVELGVPTTDVEYEVIEKGSAGIIGLFSKEAKIQARKKETVLTVEDKVRDFLDKTFKAMGMEVEIKINYDEIESSLDIDLAGEEMGLLIGKRGQTLDSLQYIVSLVINKNEDRYIKVKVDTEDYRNRRKATLESLAKNIAFKVKKTRSPISLEPMNPYERRIIHAALQGDRYITTKSEGEDPNRYVVVSLKPMSRPRYASSGSRYSSSGSRYSSSGSRYSSSRSYSSRGYNSYKNYDSEEKTAETTTEE